MAKTLVVDPAQHTRVPFLRGILTRSLQDAGLAFDDAYAMASHIRHDLLDTSEITTKELQERVVMQLHEGHDPGVVQRYLLALEDEEYAEAYNYLTSDLRDRCSFAVFVRRAPSTRVRDTRLTLDETQRFDDSAFVRTSSTVFRPVSQLDFPLRPSEYTYERTYNLKLEDGQWRMAEPDWWCPPEPLGR